LLSVLSVAGSLMAGREARAWFDPAALRLGVSPIVATREPALFSEAEAQQLVPSAVLPAPARPGPSPKDEGLELPRPLSARPLPAVAPWTGKAAPTGELALFNVNGSQTIRVHPFDGNGMPNTEAFAQLREFMRCRRSGQAHDMNPRLVALLTKLSERFDGAALHVISAHRVADQAATRPSSQHTRGTAADIRIPSVSLARIAEAARELGAGGIGLYPASRFVHVDVREQPYYWRDLGDGPVATRAPF